MSRSVQVDVVSQPDDPDCIVEASGDFVGDRAFRLEPVLWRCMADFPTRLLVDMSAVVAVDAAVLGVLVTARRHGTVVGTDVLVRSPSPVVEDAIDAANLSDVLPMIWPHGPGDEQRRSPFDR